MSDTQLMQRFFSNYMSSLDRNHVVSTQVAEVAIVEPDQAPDDELLLIPKAVVPIYDVGEATTMGPTLRLRELPNLWGHSTYELHWAPSKVHPTNGWIVKDKNNGNCAFYFSRRYNAFRQESFENLLGVEISFLKEALIKANSIKLV